MTEDKQILKQHGKRVRIAMAICGLKLPEFGRKYKISLTALYEVEKGTRPLTQKLAHRIAIAVRQEGYFCTPEWLLTGEGVQPCKETELQKKTILKETNELLELTAFLDPEIKIIKESALFQELNQPSVVVGIFDDGMEPFYSPGDYVGGIIIEGEALSKALDKPCIIQLSNDTRLVRLLKKGNLPDLYHLSCLNISTKVQEPILFNQAIKNAAPVIWHRRKEI